MNHLLDFVGLTGAIVFSVALGLSLEWLALRGLIRLMPATPSLGSDARKKPASEHYRGAKAA